MHAEPLQTQVHDDSGDESDGDDSAADTDADTGNAAPADASSDTSDRCEVCLLQPSAGVALVPCGHSRFCATCADTVASMDGATENAGVEKAGADRRGGKCRRKPYGTPTRDFIETTLSYFVILILILVT